MSKVTLSALSRTYFNFHFDLCVCNQYPYISNESNNSMKKILFIQPMCLYVRLCFFINNSMAKKNTCFVERNKKIPALVAKNDFIL